MRICSKMHFAKRKFATFLVCLTFALVVMTVNFYMGPTGGGSETNFSNQEFSSSSKGKEQMKFKSGEESISLSETNHRSRRPTELPVADEIARAQLAQKKSVTGTHEPVVDFITNPDEDDQIPVISPDGARYIPRRRVVHFDLKGAPPKLSYFKAIFPMLRSAGATTLLMEYEDMFPFWGELRNISATNAYSESDVSMIHELAKFNQLEIIPLVQTFGHMEFVLKLEEFQSLREELEHPQAICPSNEKAWHIVTKIIDQVMSLHPDSNWLHVGCDEVFQLGSCPVCADKMQRANNDPKNSNIYYNGRSLFLDHVRRVASYVREKKKLIPIIWDDMLREIPEESLRHSGIGTLVEPMIWVYVEDVDRFVDPIAWTTFGNVFSHFWSASAFKGAFGERLYQTKIERHVGNNVAWLDVMRRETLGSNRLNFRGIVVTGWSRYDHFAVLCELLPSSMPSLILNLAILKEGVHDSKAAKETSKILQCSKGMAPMTRDELARNPDHWELQKCKFPGANLLSILTSYDMNRLEIENVFEKVTKRDGWMSDYNVKHKFSSSRRVGEQMRSVSYLPSTLRNLRTQVQEVLSQYYDEYTVAEWVEQHIRPLEKMVETMNERARLLTSRTVWPRRPLAMNNNEAVTAQKVNNLRIQVV